MNYFMTLGNVYYKGERINADDINVPQRPGLNYDWNYDEGEWVSSKTSLESYLDEHRWKIESGGMTFNGPAIPTRERDMILINGKINYAILKGLPDTDSFTFTLNATEITMTVGAVKAIGIAMAEHVQKTVDAAAVVRPLIQTGELTSAEAVKAAFDTAFAA